SDARTVLTQGSQRQFAAHDRLNGDHVVGVRAGAESFETEHFAGRVEREDLLVAVGAYADSLEQALSYRVQRVSGVAGPVKRLAGLHGPQRAGRLPAPAPVERDQARQSADFIEIARAAGDRSNAVAGGPGFAGTHRGGSGI